MSALNEAASGSLLHGRDHDAEAALVNDMARRRWAKSAAEQ
jgi:hypothetical protein